MAAAVLSMIIRSLWPYIITGLVAYRCSNTRSRLPVSPAQFVECHGAARRRRGRSGRHRGAPGDTSNRRTGKSIAKIADAILRAAIRQRLRAILARLPKQRVIEGIGG